MIAFAMEVPVPSAEIAHCQLKANVYLQLPSSSDSASNHLKNLKNRASEEHLVLLIEDLTNEIILFSELRHNTFFYGAQLPLSTTLSGNSMNCAVEAIISVDDYLSQLGINSLWTIQRQEVFQIGKRDPSIADSFTDLICHTTITTSTTSNVHITLQKFVRLSLDYVSSKSSDYTDLIPFPRIPKLQTSAIPGLDALFAVLRTTIGFATHYLHSDLLTFNNKLDCEHGVSFNVIGVRVHTSNQFNEPESNINTSSSQISEIQRELSLQRHPSRLHPHIAKVAEPWCERSDSIPAHVQPSQLQLTGISCHISCRVVPSAGSPYSLHTAGRLHTSGDAKVAAVECAGVGIALSHGRKYPCLTGYLLTVDKVLKRTLKGLQDPGIQVASDENPVDLKYVKHIVIVFEEEKAQVYLDELVKVIPSFCMHCGPTWWKFVLLDMPLTIHGETLEVVERFAYLGSCLSSECSVGGRCTNLQGSDDEDNMAFGWPTMYCQLDLSHVENREMWDKAVFGANEVYKLRVHNLFCDNCYSHVARALNGMRYRGRSNWNMFSVTLLFFSHARYVNEKNLLREKKVFSSFSGKSKANSWLTGNDVVDNGLFRGNAVTLRSQLLKLPTRSSVFRFVAICVQATQ
ncbi:transmembrane protein 222 [Clonorchis sinensis]|uniref:Transmembrane protein 222 n=1 Tax=Clonorchis sinensis TaxID=79923 RepID=G7YJN8_CLOSI|nr:transmembrane protein 222 [Clonorchis sinensis]